jgi:hypothetical protein
MVAIPEGYESLLERPLYGHLATRYSGPLTEPPPDKAHRVILTVRPTGYSKQ